MMDKDLPDRSAEREMERRDLAERRARETAEETRERMDAETAGDAQELAESEALENRIRDLTESERREYARKSLEDSRLRADELAALRGPGPEQQAEKVRHEMNEKTAAGELEFDTPRNGRLDGGDLVVERGEPGERDGVDQERFWDNKGRSRAEYEEMAEKYPRVQQELEQGRSLEDLEGDPELGQAVRFWHNERDPVQVTEYRGRYFVDSGRHRAELARLYDLCDVPVRVTRAETRR